MIARSWIAAGLTSAIVLCGAPPAAGQSGRYALVVDRTIDRVIVPGYAALATATGGLVGSLSRLCSEPGAGTLEAARAGFAEAVIAFSRVELFRFGPARENNRFERLFFWPDRRGRARRQVEALIARADEKTLDVAALREKSVAVQGFLALEYVLAGKGSQGLADGSAAFRCRQGLTVAGAIDRTVRRIHQGWVDPDGFDAVMRGAGPDNPVYRSHGEVVEDFLGAASEQLAVVVRLKLQRMLRDGPKTARPKAAPFWRSGLARASIVANVDGVAALLHEGDLGSLLPDSDAGLAEQIASGLREARDEVSALSSGGLPETLSDLESHHRLADAAVRIGAASTAFAKRYTAALGLAAGFNSLDGD